MTGKPNTKLPQDKEYKQLPKGCHAKSRRLEGNPFRYSRSTPSPSSKGWLVRRKTDAENFRCNLNETKTQGPAGVVVKLSVSGHSPRPPPTSHWRGQQHPLPGFDERRVRDGIFGCVWEATVFGSRQCFGRGCSPSWTCTSDSPPPPALMSNQAPSPKEALKNYDEVGVASFWFKILSSSVACVVVFFFKPISTVGG